MKDEGSWIYFLVIIALSIIGALKKKKQDLPPQLSDEEEEEVTEDIAPVQQVEHEKVVPVKGFINEVVGRETSFKSEGVSVFDSTTTLADEIKLNGSEESFDIQLTEPDEIRKGIIYSEILKRKYF